MPNTKHKGGHQKGQPAWNKGTSKGWIDPRGYRVIVHNGKQVREHRVIMEKDLGRKLESWEHVHHKDGDKTNNSLKNLELTDGAAHAIEHHKNSKRPDQAKRVMSTIATMRQEIKRLNDSNSDLLEALKDARNKIIQLAETCNALSPKKVRVSDFTESIEQAIAKAEGK